MDKYSQQLHRYLLLLSRSALLVKEGDRRNMRTLLTMLGPLDQQIVEARYALFGQSGADLDALARRYRLTAGQLDEIIAKDLRRLAITPEWQMLLRQMSPLVRSRLEAEQREP